MTDAAQPSENATGPDLWRDTPTRSRTIRLTESLYDWIGRTDDPKFANIRDHIQSLYDKLPGHLKTEFAPRLRSKSHTDFHSCYNELWYRSALENHGLPCQPPSKTDSGSLPDWTIAVESSPIAVAECYSRLQPEDTLRNEFIQHQWFDATLKRLNQDRIRIWIHEIRPGHSQPSPNKFAKFLDDLAQKYNLKSTDQSIEDVTYTDSDSNWSMDISILLRSTDPAKGIEQLVCAQFDGICDTEGPKLFRRALKRKKNQHKSTLPTVICIGWNYYEHEPEIHEAMEILREEKDSLDSRGVCGVFWSTGVVPWNPTPRGPVLLHWNADSAAPLLEHWTGETSNCNDISSN